MKQSNLLPCLQALRISCWLGLLTVLLAFIPTAGFGQTYQWAYGTGSDDVIFASVKTNDGGLIMGGYTEAAGAGMKDVLVVKTNSVGAILWAKTYGGTSNDECRCISQTTDGGFLVSGATESFGGGNSDGLLMKLDASGNVLWSKAYGDGGKEVIYAHTEAFGRIILAGKCNSYAGGVFDECQLTYLDQQGDLVWSRVFGGGNHEVATGVVVCADNSIMVCGTTLSYGFDYQPMVAKLDTSGNFLWFKVYGSGASAEICSGIARDNGNSLIVSGYTRSWGSGGADILAFKIDQTGTTAWAKAIGGSNDDMAHFILNPLNGSIYLSGLTQSYGYGNLDYMICAIDNNGALQWSKTYGSAGADGNPNWSADYTAKNLSYTGNGFILAEGSSGYSATSDAFLMRTTLLGEIPMCNDTSWTPSSAAISLPDSVKAYNTFNPTGFVHIQSVTGQNISLNNLYECGCTTYVNLGQDTAFCDGSFIVLNAGSGFATYNWNTGAGTQTITASTQGYYSVTVVDNLGCTASDSVYVAVIPLPNNFSIGEDTVICEGYSVLLDAGPGYTLYQWQDGSTDQTYLATNSGIYSVSVMSPCGIASDSVLLTEMPLPVFSLGPDQSVCQGTVVDLNPGNFSSYLWQDNSSNQIFSAAVSGQYSVTVTDTNGCQADDGMYITMQTLPVVDLGEAGDLCELNQVLLDAGIGAGILHYLWQDGSTYQTFSVSEEGLYSVTVSNSCGDVSDSVFYADCPDCIIEVPNAFSPNGDGINDILLVVGYGFERMQLLIYDRFGEMIFESKDPAIGWDGTVRGVLQANEVFYYYLNADCRNGKEYRKKGDITLVK